MRLFLIAAGSVPTFVLLADEATQARWAAENQWLDTNTAALPDVQRMCAELASRHLS